MDITYLQVKTIRSYITEINSLTEKNYEAEKLYNLAKNLDSRIRSSIAEFETKGIDWKRIRSYFKYDNNRASVVQYDTDLINDALTIMKATLKGILDKHAEVAEFLSYLDLIEEGNQLYDKQDERACEEFIRRVLSVYSEAFSADQSNYLYNTLDKSVSNMQQVIASLDHYAQQLWKESFTITTVKRLDTKDNNNSGIKINISNNGGNAFSSASSIAEVKINIEMDIQQTIEEVKEACLGEEKEKEILTKLDELEEISKEKSKPKRWQKLRSVFKWIAEQGLQVAGWVVPLVYKIISGV